MKKILILTSRFSYPIKGGDILRIHNIAKILTSFYDVTVVSLDSVNSCPDNLPYKMINIKINPLERIFNVLVAILSFRPIQSGFFESIRFRRWYSQEYSKFDGCIVHLSRLARLVKPSDFDISILEFTDCLSTMYSRSRLKPSFSIKWVLYLYEELTINRYESKVFQGFDSGVFISETDRLSFIHASGVDKDNTLSIGNGVLKRDTDFSETRDGILFIGNMRSLPNLSAVSLLLDNVRKELLLTEKKFIFHIVGWSPKHIIEKYQKLSNIKFHGVISERGLSLIAGSCFCGVAPVYATAGVQNKVLDYLSLELPVVSSPCALEGLDDLDFRAILVADTGAVFSKRIEDIFVNIDKYHVAALSGRQAVRDFYSWDAQLFKYVQLFK